MKKRVLIFYDHFYPSYKAGGPTQSLVNLVRELHEDYDFYIMCKPHEMNEQEQLSGIRINEWENWEQRAIVMYWDYSWTARAELKKIIRDVKPDTIFINGLFSLYFNLLPLKYGIAYSKLNKRSKVVLSARGMLHHGALSQKAFKKTIFLLLFKLFGWHQQVKWHATDEQEINAIRDVFGKGVETAIAGNFPNLLAVAAAPEKKVNELVMGTVALISPMKNHLEIIKALQKTAAAIVWHIFGPVKDAAYWQQCKALIQQLPSTVTVHYHGELPPAELASAMNRFQLFIMPSKSENFGHALLEAFSAGKPVITTDTTPFKNLQEVKAGATVSAGHLATELPEAIRFFAAMQQDEFSVYAANAASFARNFSGTEQLRQQYQHLFTTA